MLKPIFSGLSKDANWFDKKLQGELRKISELRKPDAVIFYASSC